MFRILLVASLLPSTAQAASQLDLGLQAVESMQGCYLVDYSYAETESLQPGYTRDSRVYDVNLGKSVKEWIYAERLSPTKVRLQHVLFAVDLAGSPIASSFLKHTGEDWEYEPEYRYDFVAPSSWEVTREGKTGTWSRRITNLDDGLRYSCSAAWKEEAYPAWSCSTYAPIPGRETRDMGRKDYQALDRTTRLVAYGSSWLERQENTKVIQDGERKAPLAKEKGKNWYVRIPEQECAEAASFTSARKAFWGLLREAWDEVLDGAGPFREKPFVAGQPSRYGKILELEARYRSRDLRNKAVRDEAKAELKQVIESFRVR